MEAACLLWTPFIRRVPSPCVITCVSTRARLTLTRPSAAPCKFTDSLSVRVYLQSRRVKRRITLEVALNLWHGMLGLHAACIGSRPLRKHL
eukprot:252990-Amphidinium_carterae.1